LEKPNDGIVVNDCAAEEVRPGCCTRRNCEELDGEVSKIGEHLEVDEGCSLSKQLGNSSTTKVGRENLLAHTESCRI
jgi:hypothetical protein